LENLVKNNIVSPRTDAADRCTSIPLTRIQKLIAKRMLMSKQTKPCFYISLKADITDLMELRHKLKKSIGYRVTTNAFFIRALALAAKKYTLMVGQIKDDCIKIADSINVGFAVNAPHGLIVPVVKDADKKGLVEIANIEESLTDRARDNVLTLAEIEGETIALSNLGAYGIDNFVAIVPPPACTVLAIGNVMREVVPLNGTMVKRKLLYMSLAVDYRVVTGTYAAQFLTFIKYQLENPRTLTD
jgi:pyruvate dehydrogenase E2 component (dihydrolipoamide acetyltransferase)